MVEYHYDPQDGTPSKHYTELFKIMAMAEAVPPRGLIVEGKKKKIFGLLCPHRHTELIRMGGITIHTNLNGKTATSNFISEPNTSPQTRMGDSSRRPGRQPPSASK